MLNPNISVLFSQIIIRCNSIIAALTVWNSLPESVRSAETLASFKDNLKTYLFNIFF